MVCWITPTYRDFQSPLARGCVMYSGSVARINDHYWLPGNGAR
jgi:hypothetical protein